MVYVCFHTALACLTGSNFTYAPGPVGTATYGATETFLCTSHPLTFHTAEGFMLQEEWVTLVKETSTPFFGRVQRGGVIFRDCGTANVLRNVFFPVGMASETTDKVGITEHNPFFETGPKCAFEIRTICGLLISVLRLGRKDKYTAVRAPRETKLYSQFIGHRRMQTLGII